jgi:WD40 repeat protein
MISGSSAGESHAIYLSILHAEWIFIVSSSKDAIIRVWNRATLSLHCTLRGHEGPVNAIGLQASRVVSASGDGKMILWDINSGERLRTFEGHDRGLACIEFKVGYRFLRLKEMEF